MSSFKGLLRSGKPNTADLLRSVQALLTGIARCTLDGHEGDLESFRKSIQALAAQVNEQATGAEVDSAVAAALNLLREHNEKVLNFHSSHISELKTVMRTMTETITYLSESRTRSVHQLNFMERELEQATQIDDIRLLRGRLISCLDIVREETVRLQSESQARSNEVRQQIDRAVRLPEPPMGFSSLGFSSMDNVTGLPARRAAEKAISDALGFGGTHAVAVFVVKRLSAINAKYGRAVGDEAMLRVANHFAQHLSAATFLYRWSGPALVALIQAHISPEDIKRSWAKAAAAKHEMSMEAKQRSIFVLVETSMSFQLVSKTTSSDELFSHLDKFVADQADSVE